MLLRCRLSFNQLTFKSSLRKSSEMALTFLEPKEGNAFSFFRLDKAEILSKDERPENRPPPGKFVCREAVAERLVFREHCTQGCALA